MRQHRPRRANVSRWLEGAPEYVLSCHDDGGQSADRYTVYFGGPLANPDGTIDYLGMSANPCHPQGVGMSGECQAYQRAGFMRTRAGRKIRWLDLPEAVRDLVTRRGAEWEES